MPLTLKPGQMIRLRGYNYPLEVISVTRERVSAKKNHFYVNTGVEDVLEVLEPQEVKK